jgi:hypothetical protein
MNRSYTVPLLLLIVLIGCFVGNISLESAVVSEMPTEGEQTSLLPDFMRRSVESTSFHLSFFSYKPNLEQLTTLLNSLGVPALDAGLMPVVSVKLKHMPELSSQIAIGYWTNGTALPPPNAADLSATFIPISFNLLYQPLLLSDLLPLYLGGGVGYSHLSVTGSALPVLAAQGVALDNGNSGLTGYAQIGLTYLLLDDRLTLTLEAKRILKTFKGSGAVPFDLDFDGTAVGVGIGLHF